MILELSYIALEMQNKSRELYIYIIIIKFGFVFNLNATMNSVKSYLTVYLHIYHIIISLTIILIIFHQVHKAFGLNLIIKS